jgi:hypothetical protein
MVGINGSFDFSILVLEHCTVFFPILGKILFCTSLVRRFTLRKTEKYEQSLPSD